MPLPWLDPLSTSEPRDTNPRTSFSGWGWGLPVLPLLEASFLSTMKKKGSFTHLSRKASLSDWDASYREMTNQTETRSYQKRISKWQSMSISPLPPTKGTISPPCAVRQGHDRPAGSELKECMALSAWSLNSQYWFFSILFPYNSHLEPHVSQTVPLNGDRASIILDPGATVGSPAFSWTQGSHRVRDK